MVISPVWSGPNVYCNLEVKGTVHDPLTAKHPPVCLASEQSRSFLLCKDWTWSHILSKDLVILCTYLCICPLLQVQNTRGECVIISLALWCTGIGIEFLVEGFVGVRWKRCSCQCALLCRHFCSMWSKGSLEVVGQDLPSLPNTTGLLNKNKGSEDCKYLCMWCKQTPWFRDHYWS